jgi:hypothetical protein
MDPDRGDPTQTFSPPPVSDHETDRTIFGHRLEANDLRKRKRRQTIDPGPGITAKTGFLQRDEGGEIAPGRLLDERPGSSCRFLTQRRLFLLAQTEVLKHAREFHREDELGRRAGTHGLQGFEVLQGHRLLVDGVGDAVNLV